ncbi:ABC transporter permease [Halovivax cerinus]|uniref:ABC transporter permease n=1 Tax=Halovivax cerinus TaxID=1487865 RepID=A0ABD5NRA2_9EURY|nr:ABC transporter permease subunit [Halovivax cerinus]
MSTASRSPTKLVPAPLVANRRVVFIEAVASIVVLWGLVAWGLNMTDTVSSPILVADSIVALLASGEWVPHFSASIRRILYGFVLATLLGTSLGVLMGLSEFWERVFQDYITIGLAFPSVFIAFFAAMWFGIGDMTPTVTAAIAPFPFVAQNVYQGVENIDHRLTEMTQSFDVSRKRTLWRVVFRSVLPEWFAGIRYGFAGSWKLVTLAEAIAAERGVGFMIQYEMNQLSITAVLTWTILFATVIMVFEYGILQQVEKRVFAWRQDTAVAW